MTWLLHKEELLLMWFQYYYFFFETISTLFLMLKNMLNSMNLRNACVKKSRSSLCTLVFQQLYEYDSFLKYFCVKNFCNRVVVMLIIPVLRRQRQEDFCEFKTSLHWETLSQDKKKKIILAILEPQPKLFTF